MGFGRFRRPLGLSATARTAALTRYLIRGLKGSVDPSPFTSDQLDERKGKRAAATFIFSLIA